MVEALEVIVDRISRDLQSLEDWLKKEGDCSLIKIRFPRGYLRTAESFRNQYWFIRDRILQKNIAYHLILSDVYRWLLNRTDLWGTAQEMIIKQGICLIGNLFESITKDATHDICGKNKTRTFKQRTEIMVKYKMISKSLKAKIDTVWKWRNREHLFLVQECEYGKYNLGHYNNAICTLRELRESLERFFKMRDCGAG